MSAVSPEMLTVAEATERYENLRAEVAHRFGSVEAFVERAESFDLDPVDLVLYDKLRGLEYLLHD